MNRSSLRLPAAWLFGIFALYGCVLAPLYQYLISDILLQDTLWLDLVDLLFQHTEIYGDALLLGFLIGAVYRYGVREARPMLLLGLGALAFKYLATVIAISILYGSVDLTGGLTGYLFAFLLEAAIAALAVLLTQKLALPTRTDGEIPARPLFSVSDRIKATVLYSVLAVLASRLIAEVISEISFAYAWSPSDIPVMLLYWLIMILIPSFIAYFIALRCVRFMQK